MVLNLVCTITILLDFEIYCKQIRQPLGSKRKKGLLLLGIVAKFFPNLSELINFCSAWNNQKTYCFLMILGRIEVN